MVGDGEISLIVSDLKRSCEQQRNGTKLQTTRILQQAVHIALWLSTVVVVVSVRNNARY